jgi:hypothetical protein
VCSASRTAKSLAWFTESYADRYNQVDIDKTGFSVYLGQSHP